MVLRFRKGPQISNDLVNPQVGHLGQQDLPKKKKKHCIQSLNLKYTHVNVKLISKKSSFKKT